MDPISVSIGAPLLRRSKWLALVSSRDLVEPAVPAACCFAGSSAAERPIRLPLVEAARLVRELSTAVQEARTSSEALHAWCMARGLGSGPIRAVRQARRSPVWPDRETLKALDPAREEELESRRVLLIRGRVALGESDTWHLPDRLLPRVRLLLQSTDVPLAAAIAPRRPMCRTTWVRYPQMYRVYGRDPLYLPPSAVILEHKAVALDRNGRPLAVIQERYRAALFGGN
jgi:hypothetical protein